MGDKTRDKFQSAPHHVLGNINQKRKKEEREKQASIASDEQIKAEAAKKHEREKGLADAAAQDKLLSIRIRKENRSGTLLSTPGLPTAKHRAPTAVDDLKAAHAAEDAPPPVEDEGNTDGAFLGAGGANDTTVGGDSNAALNVLAKRQSVGSPRQSVPPQDVSIPEIPNSKPRRRTVLG